MIILFAILFGLIVGSFLNVAIYRMPDDESVVTPPSHCRRCKEPIAWYDNVPVLSYFLLRGRCRSCGDRFSARYPLVEALTGLLFGVIVACGLPPRETALYLALTSALIVITFIDIDYFIIPDRITLPSLLVAPAAAFFVGHVPLSSSLAGIVIGGGLLWAFGWAYERMRGQEGMGFGDVKLLAMIGGFLGWQAPLFSLMVGAITGSIIGLFLMLARKGKLDMAIPFGPFLAFGAFLYMIAGPQVVELYLEHVSLF
ncbi:MAG TPA: prepilin peptidase [Candidatus Limnocylindrales bacterium]|nr:prepilin peptidase [Candidatus Limnocylindrales bacterium]